MSCEQIREDLAAYARNEIEGERRDEIEQHLQECPDCRQELQQTRQVLDSLAAADEGSVSNKCKKIIAAAHDARASDIHLLPGKDGYAVRFRVDGVLHQTEQLTRPLGQAVVAHVKAMGEMDVTDRRLPQDGRIHIRHKDADIDVRTSCMPTVFGEKITMRLLCKSEVTLDLGKLGLSESQLAEVRESLSLPAGMFIVTGPTGSGKTTLLYSMLNELDAERLNICTIEDPVEYILPGIAQTHINRKAGLEFATAVRHMLRSDPDAIMCGEIRDLETAEVLMQASITGHLTLTTLHATTAPGAIRRLLNMGVEPFIIGDSVSLICATRLVRTICEDCKEEHALTDAERLWLMGAGVSQEDREMKTYQGKGCDQCLGTGYRGRTGLFELLRMTDHLRDLLAARADMGQIKDALAIAQHKTLVGHGLQRVREGATTVEEIVGMARSL
jgi:type IV pilus assembly protein PilB